MFSHFAATSGEEGRKALMREIELGKLFGETEQSNIINFIGCVTTEGNTIKCQVFKTETLEENMSLLDSE